MRSFSILPLFILAASLPSFASADILTNLQDYWSLDGDATAAVDATNDATYSGTGAETYVAGMFGLGIDLERDFAEYLSIGGSGSQFDNVNGSVTVSAWFSTESLDTGWQAIVANGEGAAWRLARQGGTNGAAYAGGSGDITGGDISTSGFHHIVGVSEAGVSTRLWLDGVLLATGDVPVLTGDQVGNLQTLIGNNPESLGRSWDGVIDDVGIWDTALTDSEIGQIWNGGTGASIASLVNPVPEPSSLALCLFGGVAVLARRRKR